MKPAEVYARVREHCLAKEDVTEDYLWDDVVWKRKGKGFVFTGKDSASFTVKSKVEQQASLTMHPQIRAAAYVGRFGWVTIQVVDEDTLGLALDLIDESYERVGNKKSGSSRVK